MWPKLKKAWHAWDRRWVDRGARATFYPQTRDLEADQAMYQAKVADKDRYHVFDAEQDSSIRIHSEGLERIPCRVIICRPR